MAQDELKRLLPGSVLQLGDDSYAFVPLTHAVVVTAGGETKVSVKTPWSRPPRMGAVHVHSDR